MKPGCPLCGIQAAGMTPLEAFALGLSLSQESIGAVQERCCTAHGGIFAEATVRMLAKLQRLRRVQAGAGG